MERKNLKIKISTAGGGKPFLKQLKSFNTIWDNCEFYINEDIPECDWWIVYDGLGREESTKVAIENTILITTEPPSIHKYNHNFTKQFGVIITCHRDIRHPNVKYTQQALPWWVGHSLKNSDGTYNKTYDELKHLSTPIKTKLASIIVSNKTFTSGHKNRYKFLNILKDKLGDKIDIYGIGSNTVDDKWDGIAPYKYHVVIENSSTDDYWTEKLADTFLAESYPIYYGCTNIYDYFPIESMSLIDINKPEEAIAKIQYILDSNLYEQSIDKLNVSKNLILDKYQIFPMLHEYINNNQTNINKKNIVLKPEKSNLIHKINNKIKRTIYG